MIERSLIVIVVSLALGGAAGANDRTTTGGIRVIEVEKSSHEEFCTNIRDAARERRYALKAQELEELRKKVEERIVMLEQKRAEFEDWMEKREKFSELADSGLIEIYSKMRPDAAAERLEKLTSMLAASIIVKLPARTAGVILNEMAPDTVADITKIIARLGDKGKST